MRVLGRTTLKRLRKAIPAGEKMHNSGMKIDRRLTDRHEDETVIHWVWKLVGLAVLATAVLFLLQHYLRRN